MEPLNYAVFQEVFERQLKMHALPWRILSRFKYTVLAQDGTVIAEYTSYRQAKELLKIAHQMHARNEHVAGGDELVQFVEDTTPSLTNVITGVFPKRLKKR